MKNKRFTFVALTLLSTLNLQFPTLHAGQIDITGPPGSSSFGASVTVLPNGNFVITDPGYDLPGTNNAGAVYLYDGVTLALISTLTGSTVNDQVGNSGITVLSNGNYVVGSSAWNGSRGAVTWGSRTTGSTGSVSAANSLIGSTANDQVGLGGVIALTNGNYVINSKTWNGSRGAVTWCNGTIICTGSVSAANSLVGTTANDQVGLGGVTVLGTNGNYVVSSPVWNGVRGAVTWGSGTIGATGSVSAANSLVGSTASDEVGIGGVTALTNGNYVVSSPVWNGSWGAVTWGRGTTGATGSVSAANSLVGNAALDQVGENGVTSLNNGNYVTTSTTWNGFRGAVTWSSGTTGATGTVSAANSLVGSTANDGVGLGGVTALSTNGNYVVSSAGWNGSRGAATWGSGTIGATGSVSAANSLVGSAANDQVGLGGVTALTNGNFVVSSSAWNGSRGAVTWGSGTIGATGSVSAANSLVGSAANDQVGLGGVTALTNGNYVLSSSAWNGSRGAVTWGRGTIGATGSVSAANSLVGSSANDQVGLGGVTALTNGNYVVSSAAWNGSRGAVTWGSGTTGATGSVSAANSLVGSAANDRVGLGGVTALTNGNYVLSSAVWNGSRGAVTWGSGTTGATGSVSAANSLIGSTASDQVGLGGVTALTNGNFVVSSAAWDGSRGAVTWCNGTIICTGSVSAANSLVGSTAFDAVSSGGVTTLANGNYVVSSSAWNGNHGAVTWGNGTTGLTNFVAAANSLIGTIAADQIGSGGVTALNDGNYVVSSPTWAGTSGLAGAGAASLGGGTLGTTSEVATANSVLGSVAGGGSSMVFAYDSLNSRLLVGYPSANRVSLFGYAPEIVVQQPLNVNLADGSTRIFGAPVGTNASLTFTVKNLNLGDLTGLGLTIDGSDAAMFTVTAGPTAPVSPFGSTTFTVRFTPTTTEPKTAALHIASNDTDENPFDINLSGQGLSFTQDTDGDGLNDAAEFYWSALGFDWQVSQPSLVNTFLTTANSAGLYTQSQLQALNVDAPLLARNPTNGLFTLTIGVQKATLLTNFIAFPMTAPQTTINGEGKLEFEFSPLDAAAFFRLESR